MAVQLREVSELEYFEIVNSAISVPVNKSIKESLSEPVTGPKLAQLLQKMQCELLPQESLKSLHLGKLSATPLPLKK